MARPSACPVRVGKTLPPRLTPGGRVGGAPRQEGPEEYLRTVAKEVFSHVVYTDDAILAFVVRGMRLPFMLLLHRLPSKEVCWSHRGQGSNMC